MLTIYTDGSARGNPGPGGWAAVVASEDRVVELGGNEEHTTNNRMELTAAIQALQFAINNFEFSRIKVNTDSEYMIKGITVWVKGWQKNNWRTAAKKPVLNQDLWQELLLVTMDRDIDWSYVRGHFGHKTNERCDELATTFADKIPVDLYDGPRSSYKHL